MISYLTAVQHWRPYIAQCGYCDLNYTLVGRLEQFGAAEARVAELAGISFQAKEQSGGNRNPALGQQTEELTRKMFSELDRDTVGKLYELYKIDFEMFGYKNYL